MIRHIEISKFELLKEIKNGSICLGGNSELNIFGKLNCNSGKRMKKQHRVFFHSAEEAVKQDFRPCGHCLREDYKKWKDGTI